MAEQNDRPTIYEIERVSLFQPVPGNKRASLNVSITEAGFPRLTAFTRTDSHNDGKGSIIAAMDIETFSIMLSRFAVIAKSPNKNIQTLECKQFPRDSDGKITGDPESVAFVRYGKNENGLCSIMVESKDARLPRIEFEFTLSDFHRFQYDNGDYMTAAEGSAYKAIEWCETIKAVLRREIPKLRDIFKPRPERQKFTRGGQGGSKTPSAPARAREADFNDEDIAF